MNQSGSDREEAMKVLAAQLLFKVEQHGSRFSLCRDVDVPNAVRGDDLTLDEAEDLLQTWKLRGLQGG